MANHEKAMPHRLKLPPYGRKLLEHLRFGNLPLFIVVCVGLDAWNRAKAWSAGPNDTPGLVLTHDIKPMDLYWPVNGCSVIVEPSTGPTDELIQKLENALLSSGAKSVFTRPYPAGNTQHAA